MLQFWLSINNLDIGILLLLLFGPYVIIAASFLKIPVGYIIWFLPSAILAKILLVCRKCCYSFVSVRSTAVLAMILHACRKCCLLQNFWSAVIVIHGLLLNFLSSLLFLFFRCPSWCDRIFLSHSYRELIEEVSLRMLQRMASLF